MRQNGVVWKDLLYGVRALRRSPVFTTAAVLSLALGIGANTAIFSLLYQVVLRSLPIADPERLVVMHGSYSGLGDASSSWWTNSESFFPYPFYRDLRDRDPAGPGKTDTGKRTRSSSTSSKRRRQAPSSCHA